MRNRHHHFKKKYQKQLGLSSDLINSRKAQANHFNNNSQQGIDIENLPFAISSRSLLKNQTMAIFFLILIMSDYAVASAKKVSQTKSAAMRSNL